MNWWKILALGMAIGCGLTVVYFIYPPFTIAVVGTFLWIGAVAYNFVMSGLWQYIAGVGTASLVAVGIFKGYFKTLRWSSRENMKNIGLQTEPKTVVPVGVGTSLVPEEKKTA